MKAIRGTRALPGGARCGLLGLLLSLAFAAPAMADATITADPVSPVVGEAVTFTADSPAECTQTFTFTVDGTDQPPQSSNTITRSFDTAGTHTVSVDAVAHYPDGSFCGENTGSTSVDVRPGMVGSISVSPDPPAPNQTATLSATQAGGYSPYTYAWDLDNDGSFDDSADRITTTTFTTTGPHVVRVRIRDGSPNTHETVVTRTIDVEEPAPPPPGSPPPPPPPPPPPCVKTLDFALSEFTTTGCFTETHKDPSEQYQTTAAVKLNGIAFPDFGQTFTVTFPTTAEPGGHFSAPDSAIVFGSFTVFSGNIDWSLPDGQQGDEVEAKSFSVAAGSQLFGLNVRGTVALRLGWDADGHYATFPLSIELPASFRGGPDPSLGRVTGEASLRVDEKNGPKFNGLKIKAENVWLGKLKVPEACFSYIPAGSQSTTCDKPSLDGVPYLTCASDPTTDRWDGNAVIQLPGGDAQLAAFGGLSDGHVSSLGGFATGLGRKVPITPNVYLDRVGVGLCLSPPPLKLRGDIGVSILPTDDGSAAVVDGHVIYTDGTEASPWSLEIGGHIDVFGTSVGNADVILRPYGGMDFHVDAGMELEGIATLDGSIDGWVDPPHSEYSVVGEVHACVAIGLCANGSGAISNVGAAGCVSFESDAPSPDLLVTFDPLHVRFADSHFSLSAGFGYNWKTGELDLLGSSCDMTPFIPTRSFARAAGTGISEKVAPGAAALSWRIHGSHGAPRVVVRGPHGTVITSPALGHGSQRKGHWMIVSNPTNGTTSVLLVHPAAGTWTIDRVPGTTSVPTRVDVAKADSPPTVAGQVRAAGASRLLNVVYAIPHGTRLRLVERAKGVTRTLVTSVRGHRCPGAPAMRPKSDQHILCASVRFVPTHGPGGLRHVQAVVTRGAIPISQKSFASFVAPRQTLPSRPSVLRARRVHGVVLVAFPRSRGAARYAVTAHMTDGRELSFDLAPSCKAVFLEHAPKGVGATVKVAGVRYDLAVGPSRSLTLGKGAAKAGPKGKLPRTLRRLGKVCSDDYDGRGRPPAANG